MARPNPRSAGRGPVCRGVRLELARTEEHAGAFVTELFDGVLEGAAAGEGGVDADRSRGRPVGIDLFQGNTADAIVFKTAVDKARKDFGLTELVFAGLSGFRLRARSRSRMTWLRSAGALSPSCSAAAASGAALTSAPLRGLLGLSRPACRYPRQTVPGKDVPA